MVSSERYAVHSMCARFGVGVSMLSAKVITYLDLSTEKQNIFMLSKVHALLLFQRQRLAPGCGNEMVYVVESCFASKSLS